jgi:hypothetical protein
MKETGVKHKVHNELSIEWEKRLPEDPKLLVVHLPLGMSLHFSRGVSGSPYSSYSVLEC